MTPSELERAVKDAVLPILRQMGFDHYRKLVFLRRHSDRIDRIGMSVFKDRTGTYRLSYGVGIRFPVIEAMRTSARRQDDDTPTVGVPMHFLRTPRKYFDWPLPEPIDVEGLTASVREELQSYALPFLERYSSLSALADSLAREDARFWFTLDKSQRDELLAFVGPRARAADTAGAGA